MLVLSRRREESVIVDGFNSPTRALKVTVLEIKDGRVRLGFEVNQNTSVQRAEVGESIRDRGPSGRPTGGA